MLTDFFTGVSRSDISEQDLEIFSGLVIADVRSKSQTNQIQPLTDKQKKILYSNTDLWLFCLTVARKSVEFQLSQHRTTMRQKRNKINSSITEKEKQEILEYIDQRETWRINAVKFLTQIERQQLYVKMLIDDQN
jgi:hypothetical protein